MSGATNPLSQTTPIQSHRFRWTKRETAALVLLVLLGAGLRFVRLADPHALVFDEIYYAKDACLLSGESQEFCKSPSATQQTYVHPPLGKWLIAAGIKIFGYDAFGYRVSAALMGTGLVALAYLVARKLFRDRWVAAVSGFLVATDLLLIVQSRIAMLDIFLAFFVMLGFLFLAFDRDRVLLLREHFRLPFPGGQPRRDPEYRVLAGAAFGLAFATKWAGLWALAAAVMLALVTSVGLARASKRDRQGFVGAEPGLMAEFGRTFIALGVVPIAVYLLAHLDAFVANSFDVAGFLRQQGQIFDFHSSLSATHPYSSTALTWPLLIRPVAYFYEDLSGPTEILAVGNPIVWWAAIPAGIWLLVRSFRRWRAERFVAAAWIVQYGFWVLATTAIIASLLDEIALIAYVAIALPFLVWSFFRHLVEMREWPTRDRAIYGLWLFVALVIVPIALAMLPNNLGSTRTAVFFFYMTPIAPFMAIGLAAALGALRDVGNRLPESPPPRSIRWLTSAYLGVVALSVIYLYPLIAAVTISPESWQARLLLQSWR